MVSYLIQGSADSTEKGKCNEGWLDAHKAKAFKETRSIPYEGEQQELSHEIELDHAEILQSVLQLPVPCNRSQLEKLRKFPFYL